jgi:hypothetical protein
MAGRKASDGGGQAKTNINILIFSWNVGNMMPDERELAAWLPDPGPKGYDWDIVAVGTQENAFKQKADKLNTKAESEFTSIESEDARGSAPRDDDDERVLERLPANATQKNREKDAYLWDDMVMKRLGRKYMRVKHVALWEMRLTVYAKAVWNRKIANVESSVSATGVAGLLGNKGTPRARTAPTAPPPPVPVTRDPIPPPPTPPPLPPRHCCHDQAATPPQATVPPSRIRRSSFHAAIFLLDALSPPTAMHAARPQAGS